MAKSNTVRARFCPSCRSFNVKYTFGLGNLFGVIPRQLCGDCSFVAPEFPILETTKGKLNKKVAKKKTSRGVVSQNNKSNRRSRSRKS